MSNCTREDTRTSIGDTYESPRGEQAEEPEVLEDDDGEVDTEK